MKPLHNTAVDEVTFIDYDTSIWTIEYGAVCWSDDSPDCIYQFQLIILLDFLFTIYKIKIYEPIPAFYFFY